jgi:pimeloyl-ACP methyl ester carboxylesterase
VDGIKSLIQYGVGFRGRTPLSSESNLRLAWRIELMRFRRAGRLLDGTGELDATGTRLHEALDGSRFVLVKGGPHGLLWTHAEEVNRALLDFLQAAQAPRRAQPQAEAAEPTVH